MIVRDGVFDFPDRSTLPPDGGSEFNRLVFASSPYLLQHARNPVDWYEWGDEAFERARREDRPVFLSIGYSTCHWCHVMEHESFEDAEVAAFLNEHYVSIKLDREERPDIDHIYMTVCQAMTGSGGWPLSVFLTPDARPFYAGTYFPKHDRFGRPGFLRVLHALHAAWVDDRAKIHSIGDEMRESLSRARGSSGVLSDTDLVSAERAFAAAFDAVHGGFGSAPKFPTPHIPAFLLRRAARTGDAGLRRMAMVTLRAIARGGIRDHLGEGFCRYSTDERWLVPHFEKMLYDNALLLGAYTDAYLLDRSDEWARVMRGIVSYVQRVMTSPEGAFYSAENADSEGEEGRFYVFTREEFARIVGGEYADALAEYFGVTEEGNFEHGTNVLHRAVDADEWARRHGLDGTDAERLIEDARAALFSARARRVHPSLDDKALTSWNALMISALARAGAALDDDAMRAMAGRAMDFLVRDLRGADGRYLRRWRDGEAGIDGVLEDHAAVLLASLDLYDATFDPEHLTRAIETADTLLEDYGDAEDGALFSTSPRVTDVLVRTKDAYDGAMPSGNGMAALGLLRLARLTGRVAYEERARGILHAFGGDIRRAPTAFAVLLTALDMAEGASREIVLSARSDDALRPFLAVLRGRLLPGTSVLVRTPATAARLAEIAPFTAGMEVPDGSDAAAYVCASFACEMPIISAADVARRLDEDSPRV